MLFPLYLLHLSFYNMSLSILYAVCFAFLDINMQISGLTGIEQLPHTQVADGEPHNGGFVQVRCDIVWQGELVR